MIKKNYNDFIHYSFFLPKFKFMLIAKFSVKQKKFALFSNGAFLEEVQQLLGQNKQLVIIIERLKNTTFYLKQVKNVTNQ